MVASRRPLKSVPQGISDFLTGLHASRPSVSEDVPWTHGANFPINSVALTGWPSEFRTTPYFGRYFAKLLDDLTCPITMSLNVQKVARQIHGRGKIVVLPGESRLGASDACI